MNLPKPNTLLASGVVLAAGTALATPTPTLPAASLVQAAVAHAAMAQPGTFASADALLDALEVADQGIDRLSSRVRYTRFFAIAGDMQQRVGDLYFVADVRPASARREGLPRRAFRVDFETLMVGRRVEQEQKTYVFDGEWLAERAPAEKLFIKQQIAPPGESVDPLRIGEGPFVVPVGQRKAEIVKRYSATLAPEAEGISQWPSLAARAAGTVQLKLEPLATYVDQSDHETIRVWYDRGSLLPVLALTVGFDGDTTVVEMLDVLTNDNARMDDAAFDTTPPSEPGWDVQVREWRGDTE